MAGDEPIASASIDVLADASKMPAQLDAVAAEVKAKAEKIEREAAIKLQVTADNSLAKQTAGREGLAARQAEIFAAEDKRAIQEYANTAAIATEASDRMAASQNNVAAATQKVGDSAGVADLKIAAIAGAASAAAASIDRAYKAFKAFSDASNQLGKDLADITSAFGAIAAVQLDSISAQVNATEKLAAAQRQAVHEQEMSRNLLEDIVEYSNDNASSTVLLNQIESERAGTLARIAAQEKEAAAAAKEQERAAFGKELAEGKALMLREESRLARQDEIEQEKKLAEATMNRIELEKKLQEEQKKTAAQLAEAVSRAVIGAQQQIASLFKSDEIVTAIENIGELVSAINTKASRIGSGD